MQVTARLNGPAAAGAVLTVVSSQDHSLWYCDVPGVDCAVVSPLLEGGDAAVSPLLGGSDVIVSSLVRDVIVSSPSAGDNANVSPLLGGGDAIVSSPVGGGDAIVSSPVRGGDVNVSPTLGGGASDFSSFGTALVSSSPGENGGTIFRS